MVLIEHPASAVRQGLADPLLRGVLIGLAMGMTAIAIVHSPLGKRSGAHFNPAVTFTFFRLGRVQSWDAAFYSRSSSRRRGGRAAVGLDTRASGSSGLPVNPYVATRPGNRAWVAFAAEVGDLLRPHVDRAQRLERSPP